MKLLKRIAALLLAVAFVLTVAACASSDDSDTGSRRKKNKNKNTLSSSEITSSASSENTESNNNDDGYLVGESDIQTALFGDLEGTKLRVADDAVISEWKVEFYKDLEEKTGMTVEIEPMSSSELMNKISQAVASGDTKNYFDVGICTNANLLNAVYSNIAIPMDSYIYYDDPVWKYDDATDFNALDLFKIDGRFYGAPSYGFHENFIFYNKTYFEEVGAPDPYEEYYLKDNWTFETFLDICEAVTKKNSSGKVETYAWATWNYFTFPAAAGNNMIEQNPDSGKWEIIFDQPNGIAGLNVLYESAKNGWLNTSTSGYEEFVNRKVAMIIDKPSSAMGGPDAYSRMSDEIGIVPLPKMNRNQDNYICPMIVSGRFIAACSQNSAGAAAYIYYLRLAEQNRDASESGKEYINNLVLNEESQIRRDEYIAKCDFAVPLIDGLNGWYDQYRGRFLSIMFKDHKKPSSAVSQMKSMINDSLRRTVG